MFGGASLYSQEVVFCMITREGRPHFRIGPSNLDDFIAAGQVPFKPGGKYGDGEMPYYTIPQYVMDDQILLEEWAANAIVAAKAAKKK
jgi:TfoX/Sxy family transcriptional regulator of competence genes